MDTTFYQFGVEYLRWTHNGSEFTAVKEQVEFFGKECFEMPSPEEEPWEPTAEEIQEARNAFLNWLRDEEIM